VIRSFRCAETEKVFKSIRARKFRAIEKTAIRKLFQLHSARSLNDLRSPDNSLEAMTKERVGQYSIRINDQYRLCFRWENTEAHDAEIVDCH
jgi:toxin HigB-1